MKENDTIIEESSMVSSELLDSSDYSEELSSTEERMRKLVHKRMDKDKEETKQTEESDVRDNDSEEEYASNYSDDSACNAIGIDKRFCIKELGCVERDVMLNEDFLD